MATKPNGLLIQWGKSSKTSSGSGGDLITVSNLLFTQPPMVVFSPLFENGNGSNWYPNITSISNSSFTVNTRITTNLPITWIAIGY